MQKPITAGNRQMTSPPDPACCRGATEAESSQRIELVGQPGDGAVSPSRPQAASRRVSPVRTIPVNVTIVTLDSHMASAVERAAMTLKKDMPGLRLSLHSMAEWGEDGMAEAACRRDIDKADVIVANMVFLEEHIRKIQPLLEARREHCDAIVGCLSAGEIVRQTRLGDFSMSSPANGALALLKRLRGSAKPGTSSGKQQMKMLRRLPKILKFIPGKAQDVRAYFLTLQYMLSGSDDNIVNMVRFLVNRYACGERAELAGRFKPSLPVEYPETGVYHPDLAERITTDVGKLPRPAGKKAAGTVGVILMRSYLLSGNSAHYDGVIRALEARGLRVIAAFACGLDARPAIEQYFIRNGRPIVDAVVSLTGFSLVGGPAYNDAQAAEAMLQRLDVPYLSAFAIEFQTLGEWNRSDSGLTPVETTMMVALPEIDGAIGPILFGGRDGEGDLPDQARVNARAAVRASAPSSGRDMALQGERAERLADRVSRLIALRSSRKAERRVAVVLFNFPPNGGAVATAAGLSVIRSLYNTLEAMKAEGYTVDLPANIDELRALILEGNAERYGMPANVHARISANDHVTHERYLDDIEAQWGPAPGRQQSDGSNIFVLGRQFGNVFVGIQPAFGYEGDPMRLLFEKSFAPTHAFSAFYRYLTDDFGADAVLHFGTHGALEFMPGKQVGLSGECWPDRLIGALPNFYLYAANNPSEGTIAKRRGAATLVSYLTPPVTHAGLYRGLIDLKASIDRWRATAPDETEEIARLATLIQNQAMAVDLVAEDCPPWQGAAAREIQALCATVAELEETLIPHGLHVVGEPPSIGERADLLAAMAELAQDIPVLPHHVFEALAQQEPAAQVVADLKREAPDVYREALACEAVADHAGLVERLARLETANAGLMADTEIPALIRALDGGYIAPVSGGDVIRSPQILPTGRNIHGFDPFRLPSAFAVMDGRAQAERLIERHRRDHGRLPASVALVLWGTDNMKSEGGPIAQALALIGAKPRFDSYGRLAGADLIPLEELGRARIDVVMTLSGIFRDLLPLQTKLLAEASYLAATADEPVEQNFVRKHTLDYAARHDCPMEEAALRVFSNAAGAYGANVNQLIDSGAWDDADELAEIYTSRKCFAYGINGKPVRKAELLGTMLADVDAAYQNLESVELGITTIDHYFDTLGGISKAVERKTGAVPAVYVGDQTRGAGKVRSLSEQVALETRTRMLNPKWYEGLLEHGYEGVRQIEAHVTNTLGWSATTGQVAPWIYQNLTETFVTDETMRRRLAELNPKASAKLANRLIEAHERNFWAPSEETLDALRLAGEELEDRVEGLNVGEAA